MTRWFATGLSLKKSTNASSYVHLANEIECASGSGIVVNGKEGQLMPEGDALLVMVEGMYAVIYRVMFSFL